MNFLRQSLFFLDDLLLGGTTGGNTGDTVPEVIEEVAQGGNWTDWIGTIVMWGGILVVLYFLMIRPQRKRDKQMVQMQSTLKVGERVLTSSGFYGKIVDVGQDAFIIEFGDNRGVRVPVRKSDVIAAKTPDMTPPSASLESDKKDDEKK